MSVISWFGGQDLSVKYGIALGALFFITIVLALMKLLYTRQKIKRLVKQGEIARSEAKEEMHVLNQKDEEEGDFFGVRALERGFYGGVTQSRPSTPVSLGSTLVQPKSVYDPSRPNSRNGSISGAQLTIGLGAHGPARHSPSNSASLAAPPSPTFSQRNDSLHSHSPSGSIASNHEIHASKPNSPTSSRFPASGPSALVPPRALQHSRQDSNHQNEGSQKPAFMHQANPSTSSFNGKQFMAWSTQSAQGGPASPSIPKVVVNGSEVDAGNDGNQR